MRIGVVSDTHLTGVSEEFLQALRRSFVGVDRLLHCGDYVDPSVLEMLEAEGWEVIGVAGNMDPPSIRGSLPATREVRLGQYRVGLTHGWGAPTGIEKRVVRAFEGVDGVVFGHSHRPFWGEVEGIWAFNPGAACGWGSPKGRTVGILDLGKGVRARILVLGEEAS
jgi:hypothetical protein